MNDFAKCQSSAMYIKPIVGYLIPVENVKFSLTKMPNRFHRWMMTLCFGFQWETITYSKTEFPKKELLLG